MSEPLTVLIGDEQRTHRIELPELGLRERSMLIAHRVDADTQRLDHEGRATQHIARLLLQLDPEIRIVHATEEPTVTTSQGLVFGLTPNRRELLLLAYPCPRSRHQAAALSCSEPVRDVIDLGRILNRHELFCTRLDELEFKQLGGGR